MSRNLHSIEFKEQALIKVRERGTRSVQDVANALRMPVGTLRQVAWQVQPGKRPSQ